MGGYIYAFLMMPFEPRQKVSDYIALIVHHSATLCLLYFSYILGYFRVGMVIAFLHDLSDPFMEIAKIALYSGRNAVIIALT
jgi:ceramide synthetase